MSAVYLLQHPLPWWPSIDIMYSKSAELRALFTDTLNKVSQMAHNMSRSHQQVKPQFTGDIVPTTAKYWVSYDTCMAICKLATHFTCLIL